MKKKLIIILTSLILLAILVVGIIQLNKNTVYDYPKDMSESAIVCLTGWKDMSLLMPLTPYVKGTDLYDDAYSSFSNIMKNIGRTDTFRYEGEINMKSSDKEQYDQCIKLLSENNIAGVKSIKGHVYSFNGQDEITIYVVKIGGKWYLLSADY